MRTARLVALSHVEGPEAALDQLDADAGDHYALAVNDAERAHLARRADELR